MSKSVKFLIVEALENVPEGSLPKFRGKLLERDGFTRRDVDKGTEMDLADLLVSRFSTDSKAAQLTVELLEEIKCVKEAKKLADEVRDLQGAVGGGGGVPSGDGGSAGYTSKYMTGGQHFIDKHRTLLIERITSVDPILDRLLEKKVITNEIYSDIRNPKNSSYQKMRELLEVGNIRSSVKGKDCLYEVLMELQSLVMEELMEKS